MSSSDRCIHPFLPSQVVNFPQPNDDAQLQSSQLQAIILKKIAEAGGWLPFDQFMSAALYEPNLGYYASSAQKFGRAAKDGSDFVTAPELTSIFGRTLARPIAEIFTQTATTAIIEFGAGDGKLAADLLLELKALNCACTSYTIVELSSTLQARQRATINRLAPDMISLIQWESALPKQFSGVIVANEVLDAMPVNLIKNYQGKWCERGVTALKTSGQYCENSIVNSQASNADVNIDCFQSKFEWQDRPIDWDIEKNVCPIDQENLNATALVDGYLTEIQQQANAFISTIAEILKCGAAF